jgi:type I restriction enzyme S subunit
MAQAIYKEWFIKFNFPVELVKSEKLKVKSKKNVGYKKAGGKMINSKTEFGKIPEGWEVKEVGDIIRRVQSGKKYNNKTVSKKGKVPVLDQGKSGIIGYHNDEPGVIASEDNPIIVFANHTCYQNLIMFPFSAIQNILPFYPSDDYPRSIYWLHWATKDLIELSDYKGHWPEFIKKVVVVPTQKISENFEQKITSIIIEKLKLENINQKLRQARDLLLPKLISGQIEV